MSASRNVAGATIATTLALVDQFLSALAPDATPGTLANRENAPSPLLLLETAAKTLKAQVTKSSLLTVTTPFTPSAISTSFKTINESILPSLVTATLLITAETSTASFAKEARGLTRVALRELSALTKLVEARSKDGQPKSDPTKAKKAEITETTGRVWEACDALVSFSQQGLPGFTVRKAKQWLELMKDAVKELQEWDPNEDIDADDPFNEAASGDDDDDSGDVAIAEEPNHRATISAGVKEQALRVLSRIPQSIHVVVKQRLEKFKPTDDGTLPARTRETLDYIVTSTRTISDMLDEAAEGMYLGDPELCLKKAGSARALTIEVVERVARPLDASPGVGSSGTPEDKYVERALEWIRQVDTG